MASHRAAPLRCSSAGRDCAASEGFQARAIEAFAGIQERVDQAALETLESIQADAGRLDLEGIGIQGPSSTWTYLINDDPFREKLCRMLTGPGQTTFAIGAAIVAAPLLLLWAFLERYFRHKEKPRGDRH